MKEESNISSFTEQANIFSCNYLKCCLYIGCFGGGRHLFPKKLYSDIIACSQLLEDFLDYHGAKHNQDWYFYRELSAAMRHIGLACYSQKHILNRLQFYNLKDEDQFRKDGETTLCFLTDCLVKMAPVIILEAQRLGIHIPDSRFDASDFPEIKAGEMLPGDIQGDEEAKEEQKKNIVKLASDYLEIANRFEALAFYEPCSVERILELVPVNVNEVEMRRYEMLMHNLQSYFDTYVVHMGMNGKNRRLISFRGIFSVAFHLLNVMGRLLHFYERHLHEAGYKDIYQKARDRLSILINPQTLLDRTINYGLYYVCSFLSSGKELAKEILNEYIERSAIEVSIPITRGFHCRPSLLVSQIVQHYGGPVELMVGEALFDASSVLEMQWAGGMIQKENITQVIFKGDSRALKDIEFLASKNYCEDTSGKGLALPKELYYLRER